MEPYTNNHERARLAQLAATCACHNLRRASRAVTHYYDTLLKEQTGIRITQVTILVVVYLAGPQTIIDMAEKLELERTTLSRNLKPLEHADLIAISTGDDQRTRVVTLTANGERMLLQVLPQWEEAQSHMVAGIGRERFDGWLAQLSEATALAREG